ncbi:hypothetical protein [Listeria rocourtiae]|uniref:hypothetical protein n=1 Tax=Listeria rocourtiae TaxID=647910 RepID=UPI003D2F6C9B
MTKKVWLNILGCIIAGFIGVAILGLDYGFPRIYQVIIFVVAFMFYFNINKYIRKRKEAGD